MGEIFGLLQKIQEGLAILRDLEYTERQKLIELGTRETALNNRQNALNSREKSLLDRESKIGTTESVVKAGQDYGQKMCELVDMKAAFDKEKESWKAEKRKQEEEVETLRQKARDDMQSVMTLRDAVAKREKELNDKLAKMAQGIIAE